MKAILSLALVLLFCGWTFSKNPNKGKHSDKTSSKQEWKNSGGQSGDTTSTDKTKFSPKARPHKERPIPPSVEDDSFLKSLEDDWKSGKGASKLTEKDKLVMKSAAKKLKNKIKKYKKQAKKQKKHKSKRHATSPRVIRKEFRCLTQKERIDFRNAVFRMIDNGIFHAFVAHHSDENSPGAHFGPNFPGFHRMFLDLFEIELQEASGNSSMALPYFDSHSEMVLGYYYTDNEYHKSCIFGNDMLGNLEGTVRTGLFAYTPNIASCRYINNRYRKYNHRGGNRYRNASNFYTDYYIETFQRYTSHMDFSSPFNTLFESRHGLVHQEIGGNMKILTCAPNDILFWMHHCFVDYLWERNKSQRENGDTGYPTDWQIYRAKKGLQWHYANAPMKPFDSPEDRVFNIDGLSGEFTDESYQYEDAPSLRRCNQDSDCKSDFFWCDIEKHHCITKLVSGSEMVWNTNRNDPKPYINSIYCPPGKQASPYSEFGLQKARCL